MYNTISITVVDADDVGVNFVVSKVLSTLHNKGIFNGEVGVTFPRMDENVGDVITLFSKTGVDRKVLTSTLNTLTDFIHIGKPKEADKVKTYRKVDTKSKGKLIRRCIKRKGVSAETAESLYGNYKGEKCKLPYIVVNSKSTGQRFSMFLEECENSEKFNSYGLCIVSC
ncbi:type I-F CRISPR-associated protein [Vibrio phage ICP1]|nr:type I-F CRISPR-associated protein [Vibrio phage ICP1]